MANLTDKQSKFIDYFLELRDAKEAARKAGYSEGTVERVEQDILGSDAVEQELRSVAVNKLIAGKTDLLLAIPDAISVVKEILNDPSIKPRTRLNAAKTLMDRSEEFREQLGVELSGTVTEERQPDLDWDKVLEDFDKDERKEIVRKLTRSFESD